MRPLHVLVFLSPLVALYEAGSLWWLGDAHRRGIGPIRAWSLLSHFFEAFGAAGPHLPAAALVIVFLVWHYLQRDPWRVRSAVIAGMGFEAVLWCLPFIVFALMMKSLVWPGGLVQGAGGGETGAQLAPLAWQAKLTFAAGAGLYEELLFRLILMSGVHFVVKDLLKQTEKVSIVAGTAISAVAFAIYHNQTMAAGAIRVGPLVYYTLGGVYFSILFVLRGFGIAAATHALFNAAILLSVPQAD